MLCGYGLVGRLVGPEAGPRPCGVAERSRPAPSGCWPAASPHPASHAGAVGGRDGAILFPPRYRGVFARTADVGQDHDAGQLALSPRAKDMLARRLAPDAASRLIGIIERMAAAASAQAPDDVQTAEEPHPDR